jgi:CHAT domain-containing protein
LPPRRRAVQALVEWLYAVTTALSVLGLLHSGLLAANQPQRDLSRIDPIEAALTEGRGLRKAGKFPAALGEFQQALALAREQRNTRQTVRSLMLIATVQLLSFQYQGALTAAKEALELARNSGDYTLAGGASGTIASIYRQLGDFPTAETEGRRAVNLLKLSPQNAPQTRDFLVTALHMQATLCYEQEKIAEGEVFFQQAISLARQIGNKSLEAASWDDRGVAFLRNNKFAPAERSLNTAFALRVALHESETLPVSQEHLAELELKRARPNYSAALKLSDQAFSSTSTSFKTDSPYDPIHTRAKILLGLGERWKALQEFRRAVAAADTWRQGALPGDITNTQTVVELHEVYRDFAHLAAQLSLETRESNLGIEGLEVLASNRSASLREQLKLALATDFKLPTTYFEKLSNLQAVQERVTLGRNNKIDQIELIKIRTELDDLENQLEIQIGKNYASGEKNLRRNSLRHIQARLGSNQLLLSFSLGDSKSFLWAVTGNQVNLYQLDGRNQLEKRAVELSKTARDGGDVRDAGESLGRALFGVLPARLARKTEWLIAADGALLNGVPFAAIPTASIKGGGGQWLIEQHSLRFVPSELLLLSHRPEAPAARFVGIADPIYNHADARRDRDGHPEAADQEASTVTLARLAGSRQEVLSAAQSSGLSDQQVLEGQRASGEELRKILAYPPQLLHFAVHVVSPPGRPEEAALALSLKNGVPELLTQEEIATFRLPGSLVVLSGCSSSKGKSVPSAGLLGLSRAWLLAGATAVIASSWPTPDDSGRFFSSFYGHLHTAKSGSLSQRAASALAQTQLEMQRGGGYASLPSVWAAYSIISKE